MIQIERIWQDIKHGENIDLYITVFGAITLALLNVAGIASPQLITPLNLAILGLIASAMLHNRKMLEDVNQSLATINKTDISEEFPADFTNNLENAREIRLTGIHHSSTMVEYYRVFENMLKKGGLSKYC